MSDAPALLAAIRAVPDDDAPRLVYADWLEENGQPDRAEFIRVQCELAWCDSPALRRREAELLAAHHDAFAGPLAAPHLRFRFERGFIVGFGHRGLFLNDRRGIRSGPLKCYRFFPDLSWQATVGPRSLEEAVEIMARPRESSFGVDSRYRLDPECVPAAIWLGFEALPSAYLSGGTADKPSATLEIVDRSPGRELRERFSHIDLPILHSVPET